MNMEKEIAMVILAMWKLLLTFWNELLRLSHCFVNAGN